MIKKWRDRRAAIRMLKRFFEDYLDEAPRAKTSDELVIEGWLWRQAEALQMAEIFEQAAAKARVEDRSIETCELQGLLASIYLYVDWRYVSKQLTTEQKELWAEVIEVDSDGELTVDRWWRE